VPQRRRRKRLGTSTTPNPAKADAPNQVWAVDVQFDATTRPPDQDRVNRRRTHPRMPQRPGRPLNHRRHTDRRTRPSHTGARLPVRVGLRQRPRARLRCAGRLGQTSVKLVPNVLDRPAGLVLDLVGDRQRGEDDGEMWLDGLALVVVDRSAFSSCMGMRKLFSIRQSWW
jgi:hypothetical protein